MRTLIENLTFTSTTTHTAEFDLSHLDELLTGVSVEVSDPNDMGTTYSSILSGGTSSGSPVFQTVSYRKTGDCYHLSKLAFPYMKVPVTMTNLNSEAEVVIQVKLVY